MRLSSPIEGIIFDLDGTLLNTLADIGHSVNTMLSEYGFPVHPLDDYRWFIGEGLQMIVIRAIPETARKNPDLVAQCVERARACYQNHWNHETRLYDGIPALLDAVDALPMVKAILSNKPHDLTLKCAAHYLDRWHFDRVMGKTDAFPAKPDPASALEIARSFNLQPNAFVFVGDSMTDIRTATAAGMRPVGVTWGFKGEKPLIDGGCSVMIRHPAELINVL